MKKMKSRLYEGMYILNATLSDESRKKALDKILQGITEKGGEIHKTHYMGRKRLAYEIQKKREGHYYLIYFSITPGAISELWREYHLHEDMIRFITVVANEVKETLEFKPLKMAN